MSDPPPPAAIAIGRIRVSGVDAATARAIGPAIQIALAEAAQAGRLRGSRSAIDLDLSAGSSAREIARALAVALARG